MKHQIGGRTIHTEFVFPAIPSRQWDWSAVDDNYEPGGLLGYGPTPEDAIADLLDQMEE